MKALVKSKAEPGIWLQEVAEPVIGPNDVLIRVHKTAICGTDIHIYNWDEWSLRTVPVPMVTGHEFAGEVTEVGSEVNGVKPGDRVSGEGHITCGFCRNCRAGRRHLCRNTVGVGVNRPGCFAEYVSIPALNVFPLPSTINNDVGAILDPLGNATYTALSFDLVGEDVLITGAGPIRIMAVAAWRCARRRDRSRSAGGSPPGSVPRSRRRYPAVDHPCSRPYSCRRGRRESACLSLRPPRCCHRAYSRWERHAGDCWWR